jgi:hypothetical protein
MQAVNIADTADANQALSSCALQTGGMGHDNRSSAQQQSLFARSAALQKKQKSVATPLNCERSLIVDFDSSVAENNNTFVCPTMAYSKLVANGCLRNDEQRGSHKSRFGDSPSLYGTIPLKGHHTNTFAISRHRLLFAQITAREFKLLLDAESKTPTQLQALVTACSVNPETHIGAPQSHTFAISEKFCIDECNQMLSVESNRATRPFLLPKTKSGIKAIECVRAKSIEEYFCNDVVCADLTCGLLHLRIEMCEPHHFVPGLKFALLNASNLVADDWRDDNEEEYEPSPQLANLLHGETVALEVYDIIDDYRFLAVPCKKPAAPQPECAGVPKVCCDLTPWSNSVVSSKMFRRQLYQRVQREHLGAKECNCVHFYGRFVADKCGVATAYIPCPTSPQQLAAFANQLAGSALHAGLEMHVRQVTYDPLVDEFAVTFENEHHHNQEPIVRRTKNLLGSIDQYSPLSLSRNAMLATSKCPGAKQLYLERALRGAYFFEIVPNINDRFTLLLHIAECSEVRQRTIKLPPGVFKANEFVACLGEVLNETAECERKLFEFRVDFTLHPTEGLLAWQQCGIGSSTTKKQRQNFPTLGTSPYEAHSFGFLITNVKQHRFALAFTTEIAATLDFEARRTSFATMHGSRALATVVDVAQCVDAPLRSAPPCKTPKMRALYTAHIDTCTNLVTIEQKGLNPLYCNRLKAYVVFSRERACCDQGPSNEIFVQGAPSRPASPAAATTASGVQTEYPKEHCEERLPCDVEATLFDHCELGPRCDAASCDDCQLVDTCETSACSESAYLVFALPCNDCEPAVLPLCAGDVVWLTLGCRTVAACVQLVWRDCKVDCQREARFKIQLAYGARALYNDLFGIHDGNAPERRLPSHLLVHLTLEEIGFNLHMNPAVTETTALEGSLQPVQTSSQSAVSRWLGFRNARTLSQRHCYTSDSCVQSLLDERLILCIPEINNVGRKQPRYGVQAPTDTALIRHYGVLTLDRAHAVYKYDNSTDSTTGIIDQFLCNNNTCPETCNVSAAGTAPTQCLSFHLLRSDGSAYVSCGDALVASVEICYIN